MKAPIETTGNITSKIPSGITSTSKSHSLTGMAEHLSGGELNYKLQITNYKYIFLQTSKKNKE